MGGESRWKRFNTWMGYVGITWLKVVERDDEGKQFGGWKSESVSYTAV